jgi:hypothetical protein
MILTIQNLKMSLRLYIIIFAFCEISAYAGDPAVESVIGQWKSRQEKYKTARYVVTGYSERLDLPPNPLQPYSLKILIDIEKKRLRIEKSNRCHIAGGSYVEMDITMSFDGKIRYSVVPRDSKTLGATQPNFFKVKGNLTTAAYDADIWPVLEAHGIVPLATRMAQPDKLPTDHDPTVLTPRAVVSHLDRQCTLLRSESMNTIIPVYDELLVDRGRTSGVTRHTYFSGKNPFIRLDTMFTERDGHWMPSGWTYAQYSGTKAIEKVTLKVDRFESDVPVTDEDFVLVPKSGDIVQEQTFPEPGQGLDPFKPSVKTLESRKPGTWETTSETGFTTAEGAVLPPERSFKNWRWLILVPLVLVAGLLVWQRVIRPKLPG